MTDDELRKSLLIMADALEVLSTQLVILARATAEAHDEKSE